MEHGFAEQFVSDVVLRFLGRDAFKLAEFINEVGSGVPTKKVHELEHAELRVVKGSYFSGRLTRAVSPALAF
jgi:hypothetical protein